MKSVPVKLTLRAKRHDWLHCSFACPHLVKGDCAIFGRNKKSPKRHPKCINAELRHAEEMRKMFVVLSFGKTQACIEAKVPETSLPPGWREHFKKIAQQYAECD